MAANDDEEDEEEAEEEENRKINNGKLLLFLNLILSLSHSRRKITRNCYKTQSENKINCIIKRNSS